MGSKGGLFGCADSFDRLLMLIGAVGSIGEGLAPPLTMYVLSGAIDAFGTADQSIAIDVVKKVMINTSLFVQLSNYVKLYKVFCLFFFLCSMH